MFWSAFPVLTYDTAESPLTNQKELQRLDGKITKCYVYGLIFLESSGV